MNKMQFPKSNGQKLYEDIMRNGSSAFIGDNGQVTAVLSAWYVYIFILFEILLDKLGFAIARCSVNIDILL